MSLAVQYAVMETTDAEKACEEIVDMYLDGAATVNKHKFNTENISLESDIDDVVTGIAEDNIDTLSSYNPNIVDIGYIILDELKEDTINTDIREVEREWNTRYIIINKETKEELDKKDTLDKAINYAEYKAKNTNKDYEIHIEKYDKYNTSLEAEVSFGKDNSKNKNVILFWLTDTEFSLDDDLDFNI